MAMGGGGLRRLKILVAVLGVFLVIGFVMLLVGFGYRVANLSGPETPDEPYRLALPLAEGASIVSLTAVRDWLNVLVETPDGQRSILVIDPVDGRLIGTLEPPGSGSEVAEPE